MLTKVLVVENRLNIKEMVKKIFKRELERGEYEISWASSGEEAIENASSFQPDLVLVDPEGDLLEEIEQASREKFAAAEIIPVKEFQENQLEELKKKYSVGEHLVKKVSTQEEYKEQQTPEKSNSAPKPKFNYSALPQESQQFVQERTEKIKTLMRRSAQDIIDIGNYLTEVKERLPHGQFLNWLDEEFQWSSSLAGKFMRVAKEFKFVRITDLNITPTALYALAQSTTPPEVRKEVLERAKTGETITPMIVEQVKEKVETQQSYTSPTLTDTPVSQETKNETVPKKKLDEIEASALPVVEKEQAIQNDEVKQQVSALSFINKEPEKLDSKIFSSPRQEIVAVRPSQKWRQLGKHFIYKGHPTSPEFTHRLPEKTALAIIFLPHTDWELQTSFQVQSTLKAQSVISLYTSYQDIEPEAHHKIIQEVLEIYTEGNDYVVFSYLPSPKFLLQADKLECRCYVAEPDPHKFEQALSAWNDYSATSPPYKRRSQRVRAAMKEDFSP